ncbi:prephenate dehydrogenase/arogenate dehydrogenase family protein [Gilvimarinus sp. DA14]|uniref:prephenate dehydrogenase/arogenate dehydrogenase family protein n=1 Tax=Gilvimarinus sp. DA14 TaxID=2956798 RepID=UPI0020B70919|nr:prephenate dehydrogenase/arogenate dehydrogenase family protein [Gilvimarinus sp. DA14]UTF60760.1 prephenate dehydrogenase/arogenate dehydrogenase family protein [Gilvimarinus sp. DA14]
MVQPRPVIRKLVVIGAGLIGGSLAKGVKQRHGCEEAIVVVRRQEVADRALETGVADRAVLSLADIAPELNGEDLIFIAVPTLAVTQVLEEIKNTVAAEVTVTDGASVKGNVADAVVRVYGTAPAQVVLGHPIAGSEKSGVDAANPDLYENHRVILTPSDEAGEKHVDKVKAVWECVGAQVVEMSIAEHDQVLGATSHLPHAIAYSLVDTLAHDIDNPNIFRYAAGGFRDFTRIASSDPLMWHDIMRANKTDVLQSLDLFMANLQRLRGAIESGNSEYLLETFTRAKTARDRYIHSQVKQKNA